MSIDDHPPRAWTEADLQELCAECRRETQSLEFKGELELDTPGEKNDVEHDAQGMAAGGGGIMIYGVDEVELPDGTTAAGEIRPLTDGTLYDRLEQVLDSRGQPRLPFELHEIRAADGGMYLALEVFGRRRPHRAQDGRYYGRRGTMVRQMDEAEVQEAYRDKFLRDARAIQPLLGERQPDGDLQPSVAERVHRGLKPNELALRREETDEPEAPGWMSVVVLPLPPRPNLLDPVRDSRRFEQVISIPDRWDSDHWPLQYFNLQPTLQGLYAQLPPRDDMAPAYLVSMYRDGVMEYGTTLEPALRREDPAENRVIFSASHPFQAHDYLQGFAVALGELGYDGPVGAQVSFDNLRGVRLGVARDRDVNLHPIDIDVIRSPLWHGERSDLGEASGRIVKQVMDDVFLAAGVRNGCWFIDGDGNLLER